MFDFQSDKVDPRFAPPGSQPEVEREAESSVENQGEIIASPAPVSAPLIIPEAKPASVIPMPPPIPRSSAPQAAPRERIVQRPMQSGVRRRDWMWIGLAGGLFFVVIVMGLGLTMLINASRPPDPTAVAPVSILPTPVDVRTHFEANATPASSANVTLAAGENVKLDDGSSIVLQPWNGTSRLNILLMGIDRRPGETGLAYRSDTMMLASFDPKSKQLGILSIPRDLYVPIPGYSAPQRINSALPLGEQQRAGFGPTLAMQTVQVNLGMGVNAFAVVDFTALMKLVDDIGGIDVDVPEPISDYQFPSMDYGYDPLILSAGLQHMDGYTAQKYARTRHGNSDFDRARRQQQVLFAIRDRVLSVNSLPQLIIQAPSLYASVSQNVYTQLSLDQMIQLALWLKDLPSGNIHTGVMDEHYVSNFTTDDGAQVLVPYPGALPNLLAQVFGNDYDQP
jgi:LCP family protein required for cell wall assembly